MTDWLPEVYKLGRIDSLPNSDFLEITTVMNEYPCIIRKGQYKEGQLVSWIPYDSVVPLSHEAFSFLKDEKKPKDTFTVKSKKIRGTYSEGLIVDPPLGMNEGDSVVDYFGLTKRVYEEELPELPDRFDAGNEAGPKTFQLFKYDLDGVAKYGYVFEEGEEVLIFEKLEGENMGIIYAEDRLWVRSRQHYKRYNSESTWWITPIRMGLEGKLKAFPDLVFWGEHYGNVKGWSYECELVNNKIQRKFRVFDIWDTKAKKFLEWSQVEDICSKVELETVPLIYKGPWKNDRSLHELAEGKSLIGSCVKEGWVMRSNPESWHPKLHRKIVKLKGRDYKLKKG